MHTTARCPNAQKLDGQNQTGLLPMPQTPPTDRRTTSRLSTTTDTTTDSHPQLGTVKAGVYKQNSG